MPFVAVVDTNKSPQMPVHPSVARHLLKNGQAAIWEKIPIFTIILKDALPPTEGKGLPVKIDPGSRTSGLVVVNDDASHVVWAAELTHRGLEIKSHLAKRRGVRRSRRNRKTRYRQPRFLHRGRVNGWLPPSLMSRVHNINTWVDRLMRHFPITAISVEVARFDTQLMENPHISGIEYQRGTLTGYSVREYLYEHWERKCAYCKARDVPLEVEHILPKGGGRGGSDRISNLTLACRPCNQEKGNRTAAEYGFPAVEAHAKASLKDAAMMNATRYAIRDSLASKGVDVEVSHGAMTKFNRERMGLEKSHWGDAACVGESTPEHWLGFTDQLLIIKASGTGNALGRRQFVRVDGKGFPLPVAPKARIKRRDGFQGKDKVRADIPKGKYAGVHIGTLAFRAKGSFSFLTDKGVRINSVSPRYLTLLRHADNFTYEIKKC